MGDVKHPHLLLPDESTFPYQGHFHLHLERSDVSLYCSGRIAHEASLIESWETTKIIHATLQESQGTDRLLILKDAWNRLLTLARSSLGPKQGDDLSLLMIAQDPEGVALSASGIGRIWILQGDSPGSLLPEDHPLFTQQGVPKLHPNALALPDLPTPLLASCYGQATPNPDASTMRRLYGVIL